MKTYRIHNALTYSFTRGENILVDANIWISLYPPTSRPTSTISENYSLIFKNLITSKACPIIDTLILSEYLNCYVRLEHRASWQKQYPKQKEFRQSADFSAVGQAAIKNAMNLLSFTELRDTLISQVDLSSILEATKAGICDFNDGVYVEICRKQGWKMLTHDRDMAYGGIELLTTNESLLRSLQQTKDGTN